MKNAIATLLLGAVIAASAMPAIAAPKAKKPVTAPVKTATVKLGERFSTADLDRVVVGNQAGILKVYSRTRTVAFVKEAPGTDMVGIDGSQWAPLTGRSQQAILAALDIRQDEAPAISRKIIASYRGIKQTRTAIAMLGLFGSLHGTQSADIRQFLSGLLATQKDVTVRRQAVLSLALCDATDEATVRSVIRFMSGSRNAWETYTTRQFFEYHRDEIRGMSSASEMKRLLVTSGNPYAADIVTLLN